MTKVLDLATLDTTARAEEGADLTLCHPASGEALDSVLTLAGMDSATYRRAEARLAEKYRQQKSKKRTPEDFRRDAAETLAACTLAWRNVQVDGADLPCTRENAAALYRRFPWIFEQAQAFIGERENYLQDLSTACAQP